MPTKTDISRKNYEKAEAAYYELLENGVTGPELAKAGKRLDDAYGAYETSKEAEYDEAIHGDEVPVRGKIQP